MWVLFVFVVLLQISLSFGKTIMPVLPDNFEATIETTYKEQNNRQVSMTQYHDYSNNRVRIEREGSDDKTLIDIFLFNELTHYTIETGDDIMCAEDTIDPLMSGEQPKLDDSGHILHTANMWKESGNYNFTFIGDTKIYFSDNYDGFNGKTVQFYRGTTFIGGWEYKLWWYWTISGK
jgi:hypothetical protein